DVAENDVAENGDAVLGFAGVRAIGGVHEDGIRGVADADIFVDHVGDQASAGDVALDTYAIVGAVDGEIGDADGAGAAIGFTADRHAVAGVEMVVDDAHVGGRPALAGFDRHVVVAGMEVALGDGDIGGVAGIDAVGITGALVAPDLHAPDREAVAVAVAH